MIKRIAVWSKMCKLQHDTNIQIRKTKLYTDLTLIRAMEIQKQVLLNIQGKILKPYFLILNNVVVALLYVKYLSEKCKVAQQYVLSNDLVISNGDVQHQQLQL